MDFLRRRTLLCVLAAASDTGAFTGAVFVAV
jgi:hypothetical protein